MTRILLISLVLLAATSAILFYSNKHLKTELTAANGQIALKDEYIFTLEYAVKDLQNNIAIYQRRRADRIEKRLNALEARL